MAGSWHFVNRNRYLSGSQKLVQARMYAQGATLAALLTSFAFEGTDAAKGRGRWETIKVLDPNDPEHKHLIEKRIHHERYAGEDQWRGTFPFRLHSIGQHPARLYCHHHGRQNADFDLAEMIEAEEERMKARKAGTQGKGEQHTSNAKDHDQKAATAKKVDEATAKKDDDDIKKQKS
jgi:hypothetical protein